MQKSLIVIPARMGSTRFPGKPLAMIAGKSMLQRVWEIAKSCKTSSEVIIATDHEEIQKHAESFRAKVMLTSPACQNGTERIFEVSSMYPEFDYIFSLQGDAPLIFPFIIEKTLKTLIDHPECDIATPATPISSNLFIKKKPTGTFVVFDKNHNALYFSKLPIPHSRDSAPYFLHKHIGLYCYKKESLKKYCSLNESPLEKLEKLEQLRALENGMKIKIALVDLNGKKIASVDQKEDVAIVEKIIAEQGEILA